MWRGLCSYTADEDGSTLCAAKGDKNGRTLGTERSTAGEDNSGLVCGAASNETIASGASVAQGGIGYMLLQAAPTQRGDDLGC